MARALFLSMAILLSACPSAEREGVESSEARSPRPSPLASLLGGLSSRVWGGPRVPEPLPSRRPELPVARWAIDGSLAVHAAPSVDPARVDAAFEALELARDALFAAGWGVPLPDGGRGGTMGFDLYLVDEPLGAKAATDGLDRTGTLDAALTYALVGADEVDLEACVIDAYAQAISLGLDPAESERVRRAFAAWLTYRITSRAGCEDALEAWQREPEAGPFDDALHGGAGGALFLELLDERSGGDGSFPRELHQLMRQRTWEGEGLRASPDVWESIEAIVRSEGGRFHDLLVELSVARAAVAEATPYRVIAALDSPPRALRETAPDALPWHSPPSARGVAAGGAAYARLHASDELAPGAALRVWLQGEYGVRFSLVALALDSRGRELARRASPPGGTLHTAFVPLVVPDAAHEILLVGVGLGFERPDEDLPEPVARRLRFVIDSAEGE